MPSEKKGKAIAEPAIAHTLNTEKEKKYFHDVLEGQRDYYASDEEQTELEKKKKLQNTLILAKTPKSFYDKIVTLFVNSYVEIMFMLMTILSFYFPTWVSLAMYACSTVCLGYKAYTTKLSSCAYGDASHEKELLRSLDLSVLCTRMLIFVLLLLVSFKFFRIWELYDEHDGDNTHL